VSSTVTVNPSLVFLSFFFFPILAVLGIELGALYSSTLPFEPNPQPFLLWVIFQIGSHSLRHQSFYLHLAVARMTDASPQARPYKPSFDVAGQVPISIQESCKRK
jgi:hypothetical protein